ncbi:MAG: hypothetical protein KDE27_29545 [Planctomycetes bacterium]|nr:hypothetical protein [Planctomycetota bacterium]
MSPAPIRSATERRSPFCSALLALLSWLGLPICGAAQTAESNGEHRLASATEIATVLRELDAAFDAGDVDRYLAAFAPDHPGLHAVLAERLRQLLPAAHRRTEHFTRASTVLGEPRRVGPRTVVRVRHELFADGKPVASDLEDSILAFRVDRSGPPVPTFAIATARAIQCPPNGVFRCPACNYTVGGPAGWLCVPQGRDRSQALEASSFFLLGTDLACDVSVRIDHGGRTPLQLVEELAALLRSFEPDAEPGLATAWLPPAHTAEPDADRRPKLNGARIEIALDAPGGGGIARFHAVQLGKLQHLLLVRGSRRAITAHEAELDALLASYRLLDTEAADAAIGAMAHHVGGTVENGAYVNRKFEVRMAGPREWTVQQRCGGALFRVIWSSPDGARIHLTGYAVPPGMSYWCSATAQRWVEELCSQTGIELPAAVPDWQPDAGCSATAKTVRCTAAGDDPAVRADRLLRVMFRNDLLLVGDGSASTTGDWAAIRAAFDTMHL